MEAYYDFHVRLMQSLGKQAKPYEQYAKRAHELLAKTNRKECLIKLNGKVIGWIGADVYESDNNRRCLAFDGDFLAPLTDPDFYNDFKETVLQLWKKELNTEEGFIKVGSPHKQYVADFLHGELLDEMRYMDIKIADIDAALLEGWIKHTDLRGLTEVFSLYVSDAYMEKYVDAMNAGLCDIPTTMRPYTLFTSVAIEKQNVVDRKAGDRNHLLLMLIRHYKTMDDVYNTRVSWPQLSQILEGQNDADNNGGLPGSKCGTNRLLQTQQGYDSHQRKNGIRIYQVCF